MTLQSQTGSIDRTFAALRERGESALMPYLVAGYPDLPRSFDELRRIAESGADLIEVGVPFSDPVADGPTIQAAAQLALAAGASLSAILEGLERIDVEPPLVLMSYLNPLLAYGLPRACRDMARAGVAGLIVPDLPADESASLAAEASAQGLDLAQLAAPTSNEARLRKIADAARGFVYYVSVTGTTGARTELPGDLLASLQNVKQSCDLPVAVGFGISTPEQVRELSAVADGIVVGSRIVEGVRRGEDLSVLIRALKQGTRSETSC